jgi:FKBP-type peptidyl-prolyl cis-trans isomerase
MSITSTSIAVGLAVVVALGFLFFGPAILNPFGVLQAASSEATTTTPMPVSATTQSSLPTMQPIPQDQLPTQLSGRDEVVGTGATAEAGDTVTVNYVGALPDGTVFDASANHGQPFTFTLGAGQVIPGWDQGVAGMKEGGTRLLIIPPSLGYGSQSMGSIPPNSTLQFEVQLVSVKKAAQ